MTDTPDDYEFVEQPGHIGMHRKTTPTSKPIEPRPPIGPKDPVRPAAERSVDDDFGHGGC